ncbi:riboflavin synthase [Corynebacterium pseudotuberculosis]|uniref:Riboflavin synthase n=1 Tax=Corynebacterium pseudotuberculosis 258 TaxID=1168865 RepID=A0AAU8PMW5_CORPS|nr:riboflavin synthase [Corynebacterium pseudotuberculosis]AER69166.1 Riboflavin synthase alpha chain [Corynebacterium pseudotuberculosis 1/06-A]AEQ06669.1 riboflavin synthase [Corynebacterium pseudotuberculosis CIP 52.97]AFB72468.1 riboflavin synthase [Corynebacterium pseudotuberculosis 316]AFK16763.1 riboflavin synthase [Corynebacterium pseudotuberculosis 258]AKS13457.1 Riboflavin synthase alpha chain [Corynebacterium pseudotuberculosis]
MFSGIVEEVGTVASLEPLTDSIVLSIAAHKVLEGTSLGDSIAVNGVCLTVTDIQEGFFSADVMQESLVRSSLGGLTAGTPVNLERALRADGRLDGHIVQGHVDGTAELISKDPSEHWTVLRFTLPKELSRYVVEKGSISVDGTSLTVSGLGESEGNHWFEVSLILTTLQSTTHGQRQLGDRVNLEVDVLAKYVERMLTSKVVPPTDILNLDAR